MTTDQPLYITMDITNTCNARCVMCYFSLPGFKPKGSNMSWQMFDTVVDKLSPYQGSLALSCEFEPLIHPDIQKIITATNKLDQWTIRLNTNGIGLKAPILEALISSHVKDLVVSLDGADDEMNYAIRRHHKFEHILNMLKTLAEMKKSAGVQHPNITVRQTLMLANLDHVPRMVPLLAETGVNRFSVKHLVPIDGCMWNDEPMTKQSALLDPQKSEKVFAKAREIAKEYALNLDLPRSHPQPESALKYFCKPLSNGFHIFPDGRCFPCVWLTHLPPMGNLCTTHSVDDILTGKSLCTVQKEFKTGQIRKECLRCLKDTQTIGLKMANDAAERLL